MDDIGKGELFFSPPNGKLRLADIQDGLKTYSFDLPAGRSCPQALTCKSHVALKNGVSKIVDGHSCKVRCYAASLEAVYPAVRIRHSKNFDAVRHHLRRGGSNELANAIMQAIPATCTRIRIHSSGDFFNEKYLKSWITVARKRPDIIVYCYSKSVKWCIDLKKQIDNTPNLIITLSYGGKQDDLIEASGYKTATVVFSEESAKKLGLPIDSTDGLASNRAVRATALLIHGTQPKGSVAGKAVAQLRTRTKIRQKQVEARGEW